MASTYDFNIDHYSYVDLENFLKLGKNYNEYEIREKGDKLRDKLLVGIRGDGTKKYKKLEKSAVVFLEEAKRLLIERLSKTNMINMGDDRLIINKNDAVDSVTSYLQPVTTYSTHVAQGNLNKLKKRTTTYSLCMNTLFRDNQGSKDGNIMFVLPYPLKNVISLKLVSLEFPDTVYMFSERKKTNRLWIKEDVTQKEALVIVPEGNYDSVSLPMVLQEAINDALDADGRFSVSIDDIRGKITICNSDYNFHMEFINGNTNPVLSKNMGWYMGFRCREYTGSQSYTGEGIFSPIPLPYIYFILNDYNIASSTTIMGIFSENYVEKNILAKIPMPVESFQVLFDNNSDLITKKREYFGTVDISKFAIKILDQYGEGIDTNAMDFSFTLELELAYDI
jgi:hypothetical protein